MRKEGLVNKT